MATLDELKETYVNSLTESLIGDEGVLSEIPQTSVRSDIISNVKVKIDELMPEGEGVQFIDTNDTDTLDVLIDRVLDEAGWYVLSTVPLHILDGVSDYDIGLYDNEDGTGYVLLPGDFIRLCSFKMTEWATSVTVTNLETDVVYQHQKYRATRGGVNNPVVVLRQKKVLGVPKRILEYYSLPENSTPEIEHFIYIPKQLAENIQGNLSNAVEWACVWKVLEITERREQAKIAFQNIETSYKNLL